MAKTQFLYDLRNAKKIHNFKLSQSAILILMNTTNDAYTLYTDIFYLISNKLLLKLRKKNNNLLHNNKCTVVKVELNKTIYIGMWAALWIAILYSGRRLYLQYYKDDFSF